MSMANELAFQNNTNTPFQTNDLPQPIRIIPKAALRRESPVTGLLRENNSLLSSRMNTSHLTPAALPRPANMSKCRERPSAGTGAGVPIEQGKENLRRERPMSREKPIQDSVSQLTNRPPLANQSFSRENQLQRFQAPLRVRKNSELPEHKSAMIPSAGCTGKLIEKSRQKVAEKHASRIENSKNRDATPSQQDQLLSMIEITKNNLKKDQQVIRHYMHKHKKTIDSLEQKHYEKSFERRKI